MGTVLAFGVTTVGLFLQHRQLRDQQQQISEERTLLRLQIEELRQSQACQVSLGTTTRGDQDWPLEAAKMDPGGWRTAYGFLRNRSSRPLRNVVVGLLQETGEWIDVALVEVVRIDTSNPRTTTNVIQRVDGSRLDMLRSDDVGSLPACWVGARFHWLGDPYEAKRLQPVARFTDHRGVRWQLDSNGELSEVKIIDERIPR